MTLKSLKRLFLASSGLVLVISMIHLYWAVCFLTWENLPIPFGGVHAFSAPELQTFWGMLFLVAGVSAIVSEFSKRTFSLVLLIPQQLLLTYGAVIPLIDIAAQNYNDRLILALGYILPLTIGHFIILFQRPYRLGEDNLLKSVSKLDEVVKRHKE